MHEGNIDDCFEMIGLRDFPRFCDGGGWCFSVVGGHFEVLEERICAPRLWREAG